MAFFDYHAGHRSTLLHLSWFSDALCVRFWKRREAFLEDLTEGMFHRLHPYGEALIRGTVLSPNVTDNCTSANVIWLRQVNGMLYPTFNGTWPTLGLVHYDGQWFHPFDDAIISGLEGPFAIFLVLFWFMILFWSLIVCGVVINIGFKTIYPASYGSATLRSRRMSISIWLSPHQK